MTLVAILAKTWFAMLIVFQTGSIPIWVPLVIILLIILLFWWGLTRNSIPDEAGAIKDEHESAEEEPIIAEASSDDGSEMEVLGLGISVIALNLGMYIAAPALIGFKVNRIIKSRK